MPAQDRGRGDQAVATQRPRQSPDEGGEHSPVCPVRSRSWVRAAQDGDLVAQHEKLDVLRGRRAGHEQDHPEHLPEDQVEQSQRHVRMMPNCRLSVVSGPHPISGTPHASSTPVPTSKGREFMQVRQAFAAVAVQPAHCVWRAVRWSVRPPPRRPSARPSRSSRWVVRGPVLQLQAHLPRGLGVPRPVRGQVRDRFQRGEGLVQPGHRVLVMSTYRPAVSRDGLERAVAWTHGHRRPIVVVFSPSWPGSGADRGSGLELPAVHHDRVEHDDIDGDGAGVTSRSRRRYRGSSRTSVAMKARSAQLIRGRGVLRWSTAS
jgi:hypothetical protein